MEIAKHHRRIITILSIVLPLAVAALFGIKINTKLPIFLPPIYATINAKIHVFFYFNFPYNIIYCSYSVGINKFFTSFIEKF